MAWLAARSMRSLSEPRHRLRPGAVAVLGSPTVPAALVQASRRWAGSLTVGSTRCVQRPNSGTWRRAQLGCWPDVQVVRTLRSPSHFGSANRQVQFSATLRIWKNAYTVRLSFRAFRAFRVTLPPALWFLSATLSPRPAIRLVSRIPRSSRGCSGAKKASRPRHTGAESSPGYRAPYQVSRHSGRSFLMAVCGSTNAKPPSTGPSRTGGPAAASCRCADEIAD